LTHISSMDSAATTGMGGTPLASRNQRNSYPAVAGRAFTGRSWGSQSSAASGALYS
jgi:hypothetical protein